MIYGIGNDLVEISRMTKSIESERFQAFCFSAEERKAFKDDMQKLAGCFAAKEALSKALGTGVRGFALDEISVMRNSLGKPYFIVTGKIEQILQERKLVSHLAITNAADLVFACVVLEVTE